jgi:hypothetical protein
MSKAHRIALGVPAAGLAVAALALAGQPAQAAELGHAGQAGTSGEGTAAGLLDLSGYAERSSIGSRVAPTDLPFGTSSAIGTPVSAGSRGNFGVLNGTQVVAPIQAPLAIDCNSVAGVGAIAFADCQPSGDPLPDLGVGDGSSGTGVGGNNGGDSGYGDGYGSGTGSEAPPETPGTGTDAEEAPPTDTGVAGAGAGAGLPLTGSPIGTLAGLGGLLTAAGALTVAGTYVARHRRNA